MITTEEFKKQNEELIQEEIIRQNHHQLQIFADKVVAYGRVAEIMGLSQSSGVVKLSFVTIPKKQ